MTMHPARERRAHTMHLFPNGAIRYDANGDAWVTKYTLWWKITSLWLGLWRRTQ